MGLSEDDMLIPIEDLVVQDSDHGRYPSYSFTEIPTHNKDQYGDIIGVNVYGRDMQGVLVPAGKFMMPIIKGHIDQTPDCSSDDFSDPDAFTRDDFKEFIMYAKNPDGYEEARESGSDWLERGAYEVIWYGTIIGPLIFEVPASLGSASAYSDKPAVAAGYVAVAAMDVAPVCPKGLKTVAKASKNIDIVDDCLPCIKISTAAGSGRHAEMMIVRYVTKGEKIAYIIEEGKSLAFINDIEYMLVRLPSGKAAIVSGGADGFINIPPNVRIFGHIHPPGRGVISDDDIRAIQQLGQRKQYIYENGELKCVRSKENIKEVKFQK